MQQKIVACIDTRNLVTPVINPRSTERHALKLRRYSVEEAYNNCPDTNLPLLVRTFGSAGKNITIIPPFYFDTGPAISVGDNTSFGSGTIILDRTGVSIGHDVTIGDNVQIYDVTHPVNPLIRRNILIRPVRIGNHVRIGSNAIIMPGVTLGDGALIQGGAVVNQDVPAQGVHAGNELLAIPVLIDQGNGFFTVTRHLDLRHALTLFKEYKGYYIRAGLRVRNPHNISIGTWSTANLCCTMDGAYGISIGSLVKIAPRVSILTDTATVNPRITQSFSAINRQGPVTIHDNVWIGGGSIVMPGVTIGKNAVIAAGSIVTEDIPPDVIAHGCPCRAVKKL